MLPSEWIRKRAAEISLENPGFDSYGMRAMFNALLEYLDEQKKEK